MMKPLLVIAMVAIWGGCSSPMEVAEEAFPDVPAEFHEVGEFECPDPPEANPDPNSFYYEFCYE